MIVVFFRRMKKVCTVCLLLLAFTAYSSDGQKVLRTIENKAFKPGEVLKFRVHYGFIDAGVATLEVKEEMKKIGDRECYHVVGSGESVGAFDWFFKVRDRYESIIDKKAMIPWLFFRRVDEGGYKINQNVSFDHYRDSAKSDKKTIAIPEYSQDMISAFYYARTMNLSHAKEGDVFPIPGYLDDEAVPLNFRFIGRETIRSKVGKIKCLKLRPMLQEGRVFKDNEDMTVWLSDDVNHVPVRIQTDVLVGSIKMELVSYQNTVEELARE